MTPWVLLVGGCLLCQGFFSGSEMALVASNRALLKARAEEGSSGAILALQMLEHEEDRLLATCLIGTNVCLIGGTTVAGSILASSGYPGELLLTALYVPLGLVFGEALPKLVYRHYADALAPRLAPILRAIQLALVPALWVVSKWTNLLKRLLHSTESPIRRQDIVQLLDDREGHTIDPEDRAFIQRLLAMSEITVEEAMTPLVDVKGVPDTATVGQAIEVVLRGGHSRLPVYRDRVDNITGHVDHRDLLFAASDDAPVSGLMRPIRFVPDSKRADELLREMRETGDPFVAVVDEYGGSVGIVTMEDLLEQVVGDIADERDLQGPAIRRLSEREWRVPARTPIEELEAAIGRQVPPGEYETVAGLLLTLTGRIPQTGAVVRVGRLVFHVEAASERAVHAVRVVLPAANEPQ
ncbi:MAG: hemolysin family protein [Myxococcota bacterium]